MQTFLRPIIGKQVNFLSGSLFHIIAYLKRIEYTKFGTCITNLNNYTLIFRTICGLACGNVFNLSCDSDLFNNFIKICVADVKDKSNRNSTRKYARLRNVLLEILHFLQCS